MPGMQVEVVGPQLDLDKLNASLKQDPKRWLNSYTNHTATVLRKRALASQNGKT